MGGVGILVGVYRIQSSGWSRDSSGRYRIQYSGGGVGLLLPGPHALQCTDFNFLVLSRN